MDSVEMVPADTTSDYIQAYSNPHSPDEPRAKRPKLSSTSKQRPIGIAQPFRSQLPEEDPPDLSDNIETQDVNRFDRFFNESQALEEKKSTTTAQPLHGTQDVNRFDRFFNESQALEEKKSTTTAQPLHGSTGLPGGRQWVVFISHSTGDQAWVRNTLLVPLRELQIPAVASYHFMSNHDGIYDNGMIRKAMADSCMVIIALSPSYLPSSRCVSERGTAVILCSSLVVVVVSVWSCSRPEPLKPFLYLDFMDKSKREAVWNKLTEVIDSCMMSPGGSKGGEVARDQQRPPSPQQQHMLTTHTLAQHDEQHAPHILTNSTADRPPPTITDHLPHTITEHPPLTITEHPPLTITEHPPLTITEHPPHAITEHPPHVITDHPFHAITEHAITEHPPHTITEHPPHTITEHPPHAITDHSSEGEVPSGHMTHDKDSQPVQYNAGDKEKGVKGRSKDVEEGEVNDSSDETLTNQIRDVDDQASKVTSFYNKLARPDADKRQESPIFHMRNFNNWVKSVLIRSQVHPRAIVLDLCCGKGGDLLKWKEGRISYLVCADISDVSVTAAEGRYNSPKMMLRQSKKSSGGPPFEAEFICADCCQVRLRDRYENPGRRFHMTSCQFSIHYSFESAEKAHMMARNACENLLPGGYFVGTTVDANELVYRLREAGQTEEGLWTFGNEVFSVTLDPSLDPRDPLPLFGAKYNFKLHGVVDLPEYIIHFPTFQSLLAEFDMEYVHRQSFVDFFNERRNHYDDADLLFKMSAFSKLRGTMSAAQWEAIGLYMVFVFRKRSSSPS